MLEVGSTTNGKVFKPYWNEQYAETVSSVWLPTETTLQGLDGKSSILLSVRAAVKSWFSIRKCRKRAYRKLAESPRFQP